VHQFPEFRKLLVFVVFVHRQKTSLLCGQELEKQIAIATLYHQDFCTCHQQSYAHSRATRGNLVEIELKTSLQSPHLIPSETISRTFSGAVLERWRPGEGQMRKYPMCLAQRGW